MPYNYKWAENELSEYDGVLTDYVNLEARNADSSELTPLHNWLVAHQAVPRMIAEDVLGEPIPRFASDPMDQISLAYEMQRLMSEALGFIRRQQEVEDHWSQETRIDLDAQQLHPWVWNAAQDLWASEHWGEALEAALKVVNAKLQEEIGSRDSSEVDLVNRAWSRSEPSEGQPRLRVGDSEDPQTYTSLNEGALALGQAAFKLYRNPLAHLPDQVERQHALEGLAAVSAFARLVDDAEVVEQSPTEESG